MNNKELSALKNFVSNDHALVALNPWTKKVNFFEIAKNARTEIRHSSVLAWLLDVKGSHGLNEAFVREFIKVAINKNNDKDFNILDWAFMDFYAQSVQQEWNEKSSTAKNRLDILVVFENDKKFIAIENKTTSSEHDNQTATYRSMLEKYYKGYEGLYIYLTPYEDDPFDKAWGKLSYKDMLKILDAVSSNVELDPHVEIIIEDFCDIVKKYLVEDEELITVCNDIYVKYQEALDIIFYHSPHFKSKGKKPSKDVTAIEICEKIRLRYASELNMIYDNKKSPIAEAANYMREKINNHPDFTWGKEMGSGKRYIMFTSKKLDQYIPPISDAEVFGSWSKSKDTYRFWIDTADYSTKKELKLALELGGDNLPETTKKIQNKIISEFGKDSVEPYTYKQIISKNVSVDIMNKDDLEQFLKCVFETVSKWETQIINCLSE